MFLSLALILAVSAPAAEPQRAVQPSGQFGGGVSLQPQIGAMESFGPGGSYGGITFGGLLQVDSGPRWALRFPAQLSGTGRGFSELTVTPGILYRWRRSTEQRWVPYLGGGAKLGLLIGGRPFLGLAAQTPSVTTLLLADLDDWDDGDTESQGEHWSKFGSGTEVWTGLEWHPARLISLDLGFGYSYVRMAGANVHAIRQTVGLRLSF